MASPVRVAVVLLAGDLVTGRDQTGVGTVALVRVEIDLTVTVVSQQRTIEELRAHVVPRAQPAHLTEVKLGCYGERHRVDNAQTTHSDPRRVEPVVVLEQRPPRLSCRERRRIGDSVRGLGPEERSA